MKYRFHVMGLPHTKTTKEYNACAYTQKVYNFCKMMHGLGHTVYHYGAEGSNPPCTEHIDVISDRAQRHFFGTVNWRKSFFPIEWDSKKTYWELYNLKCIEEIEKRHKNYEFLCIIAGHCQKPVADTLSRKKLMPVEFGVGYTGTFTEHRVFESYAEMHKKYGDTNGQFYDCVIPNYYDVKDFEGPTEPKDYYLYIGRFLGRKGISVAVETASAINAKLIMAGQGVKKIYEKNGETIIVSDEITVKSKNIEHVGYADVKKRNELMKYARAVFVPTLYIEPFGGVAVEAMMCGTPVITTDWGAFTETVQHGVTGYRCRTLDQFVWAANNVHKLNRKKIRKYAIANYSLDVIARKYNTYFDMLYTLWGDGWYTKHEGRSNYEQFLYKKY